MKISLVPKFHPAVMHLRPVILEDHKLFLLQAILLHQTVMSLPTPPRGACRGQCHGSLLHGPGRTKWAGPSRLRFSQASLTRMSLESKVFGVESSHKQTSFNLHGARRLAGYQILHATQNM